MIELKTEESKIVQKTKELCQSIVDQPGFPIVMDQVDAFMADEDAQNTYEGLRQKQEFLQDKQQRGATVSDEEIQDFESDRNMMLENGIVAGFMDAQQKLQKVHETVMNYLTKTLELGRVPTEDDLKPSQGGCCGSGGCGCKPS